MTKHLNQIDLARRWNISHRTLERWRWRQEGPQFIKLGGRIVYRLEDVLSYETEHLSKSRSSPMHDARTGNLSFAGGSVRHVR